MRSGPRREEELLVLLAITLMRLAAHRGGRNPPAVPLFVLPPLWVPARRAKPACAHTLRASLNLAKIKLASSVKISIQQGI
jgi:hypothetical protein